MKHTISVLVENHSGVLSRISGLFSRRGFNIESLAVGPTQDDAVSRITIIADGDEYTVEQIEKQLENTSLQDAVEVDFNAQYVQLSLNGALLFESGKADVMEEAYPVVNKISSILAAYQDNLIEIEGLSLIHI